MRWTLHVAQIEEGRDMYRVLVGKPEGKTPHTIFFFKNVFPKIVPVVIKCGKIC
jgi:hypothetical protein